MRISMLGAMTATLCVLACGSASDRPAIASALSALTSDECSFFAVNGKVRICHYTGAAKKPYSVLQASNAGCIDGHAGHPNDYVATATDLDCQGGGCFPVGAPVDARIPCCAPLVARNGVCTDCGVDSDGDGIGDACDNCPSVVNPDQSDLDQDGIGDACDPDIDGDGVPNETDNCPRTYNPDQKITYPAGSPQNPLGLGDACNPDVDGDGVPNAIDNCPLIYNPAQDPGDPAKFEAQGLHCT